MGNKNPAISRGAKAIVQSIANKFGYEIHRLPPSYIPPINIRCAVGPFEDPNQYLEAGNQWLQLCRELCDIKPDENILDIGCGCGQAAWPLTKYMNQTARYEGFDIIPELIKWCSKNISPQYGNFNFQLADVYNKFYNPKGKYKAAEYPFPYANESFDFIFLKSVFTHMLPADTEHYLSEIGRVCKHGGKCLISSFLLNEESLGLIDTHQSSQDFKYLYDGYRVVNQDIPENAVAYDEEIMRSLIKKSGLTIVEPIRYGVWCGRKNYLSYQDLIVAVKK